MDNNKIELLVEKHIQASEKRPKTLIYEDVKRRICHIGLSADKYEHAIRYAANCLKI